LIDAAIEVGFETLAVLAATRVAFAYISLCEARGFVDLSKYYKKFESFVDFLHYDRGLWNANWDPSDALC
jgi:hypothetical protein